jgi:hypothetical protein
LFLVILLSGSEAEYIVHPVMWGMVVSAYICLCCVSIFFIVRSDMRYCTSITLLAQGILFPVVSMRAGAMFIAWIGFVMFLVGLGMSFFHVTRGNASDLDESSADSDKNEAAEATRAERVLDKLELPVCFSDSKGMTLGATSAFLGEIGKSRLQIEGEVITDVLPIDEEEIELSSGRWYLSQVKDGERFYFMLSPTPDGKPQKESSLASMPSQEGIGVAGIFDPPTGLYTNEYRSLRGPEEVSRAQRYKRSISGMLLYLFFNPTDNAGLNDRQEKMLRDAFASRVKTTLRTMDLGFIMPDNKIQILLPETPQNGVRTLVGRLMTLPRDIFDDEIREAVNPKVKAGIYTYGGTTRMEYAIFCATLEQAFASSKEGAPGVATAPAQAPSQAA